MIFRNLHPSRFRSIQAGFLRLGLLLAGVAILSSTSGCVVAPAAPRPMVVAPAHVLIQVEPSYASPGVGWVWVSHPRHGWGWHHPSRGWHRGWR